MKIFRLKQEIRLTQKIRSAVEEMEREMYQDVLMSSSEKDQLSIIPLIPVLSSEEEDATVVDLELRRNGSTLPLNSKLSATIKLIYITGITMSVIGALPVPYLVTKSIHYLSTGRKNTSFYEMMHDNNTVFWIFGPITSILATCAVIPFNTYNCHRTLKALRNISFSTREINFKKATYFTIRILALTFGIPNGYNMAYACDDIANHHSSVFSEMLKVMFVSIAILFAGIDSRVAISAISEEVPRDFRLFKRGIGYLSGNLLGSCSSQERQMLPSHQRILPTLKAVFDNHQMIIFFTLSDAEIADHRALILDVGWIQNGLSDQFQQYLLLMRKPFPFKRYLVSDIFGGMVALSIGLLNGVNAWVFTRKAILNSIFSGKSNLLTESIAVGISNLSTFIAVSMYFFLIRDLLFRDIMKPIECRRFDYKKLGINFFKCISTLVPALCFGLLNISFTLMNDNITVTEQIIVSIFAVMGATVLLRYGIVGDIEAWRGHYNLRREFAKVPHKIMAYLETLSDEESFLYREMMTTDFSTGNPTAKSHRKEIITLDSHHSYSSLSL